MYNFPVDGLSEEKLTPFRLDVAGLAIVLRKNTRNNTSSEQLKIELRRTHSMLPDHDLDPEITKTKCQEPELHLSRKGNC